MAKVTLIDLAGMKRSLGLDEETASLASALTSPTTISTSSLWQVRQPVYTRSIGRWRAEAMLIRAHRYGRLNTARAPSTTARRLASSERKTTPRRPCSSIET